MGMTQRIEKYFHVLYESVRRKQSEEIVRGKRYSQKKEDTVG